MQMQPLSSSNIRAIGHDGDNLFVDFHSGKRYKYAAVPKSTYEAMLAAESVGKFFHAEIKDRFTFEVVVEATA